LGGRVVDSFVEKKIRAPIEVFTQYHVPNYVNKDTLVILSSYSGNTEEVLSCAYDVLKRGAKVIGLTTGGKLADLLSKEKKDFYLLEPTFNPSKMPRLAIGYSITAILAILKKLDYITLADEEFEQASKSLELYIKEFGPRSIETNNLAKKLALSFQNRIPIIVSSEHMYGIAHVFKNQLNETSKTFSNLFDIPELNHHLLEGLKYPAKSKEILKFFFVNSELYSDRVKKRYKITEDVVEKNGVSLSTYKLRSDTKLEQIFELLSLSSFISFYLAVLSETDPSVIPWVDYFKEKLSR
jgi:glucose/mannose-6-phosphate isomerase